MSALNQGRSDEAQAHADDADTEAARRHSDAARSAYELGDYRGAIAEFEAARALKRAYIVNALRDAGGNQVQAARTLHMHRNTMGRWITVLKIAKREYKQVIDKPKRVG